MATAASPGVGVGPSITSRDVAEWRRRADGGRPEDVLGVPPGADPATVRAAFVALAKRFHPDLAASSDPGPLHDALIRITDAYSSLLARPQFRKPPAAPVPIVGTASFDPVEARPRHRPEVTPPKPTSPSPPDPTAKRARVAEALRVATRLATERDTEGTVTVLHDVLSLADGAEKRRIRLLLARTYLSEPAWRRYGLSILNELLGEHDLDADALALLGALYHREGLLSRAEATLRRALASDPGHAEARGHLRAVAEALRKRRPAEPPARRGLLGWLFSTGR